MSICLTDPVTSPTLESAGDILSKSLLDRNDRCLFLDIVVTVDLLFHTEQKKCIYMNTSVLWENKFLSTLGTKCSDILIWQIDFNYNMYSLQRFIMLYH